MEINLIEPFWLAVIGTSLLAFLLKYLGHSVPKKWLSNPRILKINSLIPIALLSALVAVQSFTQDSRIVADQRMAGVGVAVLAALPVACERSRRLAELREMRDQLDRLEQ